MNKCKICGMEIRIDHLKDVFHFTLGNIINGRFYGNETVYYHMDCLNGKKYQNEELLTPIN
ncbi:MAG: hypothetical protein ACFE8L_02715 [Candidatus Hodarchaeota archaeon]